MSAVKQYIDLFKENRSLIDSHSAPVLNALRDEAWPHGIVGFSYD